MSWRGVLVCLLGVGAFSSGAQAREQDEKRAMLEEFLTAEPSRVQRRGEIEVSSAFDYRRPAGAWRVPVVLEFGITDRLEVEVEASYVSARGDRSRSRGSGVLGLGAHYALRPDVERLAVTLGVDAGFPAGDEASGPGGGRTDVEFLGIAGLRMGRAELHVTGMLEFDGEVDPALNAAAVVPRGDLRLTLEANVLRGAGKAGVVGPEPAGEPGAGTGGEHLWVVATPGLFHHPFSGFEYGIGVPIGLTAAAPDWGLVGRLTVEF